MSMDLEPGSKPTAEVDADVDSLLATGEQPEPPTPQDAQIQSGGGLDGIGI